MDDKTAELRDIFIETTGSDTVTERQAADRGSLTDRMDDDVEAQLREIVATMRERYDFSTPLDDDAILAVVRGFYAGHDDAEVADELGVDEEEVRTVRLDLHLVADVDREGPLDFAALRAHVREGDDTAAIADALNADEKTVKRYRPVAAAAVASTRVNDRFRDAFAAVLTDADLSTNHAADAREDGLREATEDIETDVSF